MSKWAVLRCALPMTMCVQKRALERLMREVQEMEKDKKAKTATASAPTRTAGKPSSAPPRGSDVRPRKETKVDKVEQVKCTV